MRILQVNTEKTWRGGERQTLYTIEGLIDQGIDCQLMAIDGSLMHQKAKAIGIHVITVKSMSDALKKLANLKGDFDCIHAQTGKAHTQCILTKVFHRTPVIYTRRVNFTPRGFLTKLKYRLTNRIVSISYAISETLSTSGINQNSPVVYSAINHASIDIDRCIRLRKLLNLNKDTKIIGIISALESEKDPYTALSTINMLKNTRSDFSVLHFGDGSLFGSLSKSIEKLNLTKEYHQIGHVDNVEDFYSIMDVFFMTSKEEGLGSSVLDAFNHEASVVSTNAGGLQESLLRIEVFYAMLAIFSVYHKG